MSEKTKKKVAVFEEHVEAALFFGEYFEADCKCKDELKDMMGSLSMSMRASPGIDFNGL